MDGRRLIGAAGVVWVLAFGNCLKAQSSAVQQRAPAAPTAPAVPAPANADCLACHEDDSAVRSDGRPVVVKPAVFEKSIHGGLSCVDCHADLAKTSEFPHAETLAKVDCATCHSDTVEKYKQSIHASARASGTTVAATCVDCHGTHDILPAKDPESRTYHLKIAATCARCHGNAEVIAKGGIPSDVTKAFVDSIHGRALARSGLIVAPTCSDCHGAHDIRKPKDPQSPVARTNVPATCGKCHEGIEKQFGSGVHGQKLARGDNGVPACQTCHTAHGIQRAESPNWQLAVVAQCGTCHTDRKETFRDTFHGQVTNLGFRTVAGCADCHGAHEILPASDPRSPISPGRLVETCGKCHANANAGFVQYDPHANKHDRQRNPALYYAARGMSLLLFGVFGFFGLHTSMWVVRELRARRERVTPIRPRTPQPDPQAKDKTDGRE